MKPPSIRKTLSLLHAALWLGVSAAALADTADFQSYQPGPLVRPLRVESTSGQVSNAEALVAGRDGDATLSWGGQGPAPMVILDYGRDVGGLPVFEVSSVSGTPRLQAVYGESRQYLLPNGDGAPVPANAPGDPSRVDTYPVSGPGLIVNRLIQGGERFEAITLAAPGSVTLRRVGIRATFFLPSPSVNRGRFACSDPALSEVWGLGAYTLLLDQLPRGSVPPFWTVTPQGLTVPYSRVALYQGSGAWTDYTAAFEAQVVANEAAWVVRDNSFFGYVLILDADNDALGTPNALRVVQTGLFGTTPVLSAPLGFDLAPGTWHAVKTAVTGSQVSVYVDGRLIAGFPAPITPIPVAFASTFGFQNAPGAVGRFRNLSITDPAGRLLYASALTSPSVLADFAAGPNPLPVILDGAKRDRYVWGGDIGQSGLTLYYANGASEYVKGSLELFGSFPHANGEANSLLTPQLTPGLVPGDQLILTQGTYSLSYSIYFVTNLYDYYLYTGDAAFVAQQWPNVEKELAYLAANADAQHLVVTTADNGLDWTAGGPRTGAVTANNALYYRALTGAAAMAQALGKGDVAANLETLAGLVKNAVNAALFDAGRGVYDLSSDARGPYAQDANALAVLFGVAPPDQASSILQKTDAALATPHGPLAFSSGPGADRISPFASGYDVQAHFEAGDAAGALALIRTVWAQHMTHDKPFYSGGVFEALAPDGTPQSASTSLAHGWSSGPTSALSKYVLGVRPVEAGYQTFLVEPQPGDLNWAAGTVPTPYGPIAVAWQTTSRGLRLELWVPQGTNGTVGLPVGGVNATLSDNGRSVTGVDASRQPNGRAGYLYLQNLRPGAHLLQVTATGQ